MKILHVCKYYAPYVGGVEQVEKDVVDSLKEENEQKVICFNHERGDKEENVDGVEVVRVACQAKISSQSIALGYGKALKKLMNEFEPSVVVFHYPNPFAAHYLLKYAKKNFRLILYWHLDIIKQKILGKLFYGQNKKLLQRADTVIATSPNYLKSSEWLSSVREKCVVIPCPLSKSGLALSPAVSEQAEKIRERYKGKIICFALGRHVPYKGMEYLVRASKLLDDGVKILIGGRGPLTDELKEKAKGDDKVEFLGRISDEAVAAYTAACDIFCFPSVTKNEAFGIALADGMSYGKPAVTFTIDGSGVNYVSLNGVTGIEAENGNVEKYAEAIKTLAKDEELRKKYGAAAAERAKNLFTREKFTESIKGLLDGKKL